MYSLRLLHLLLVALGFAAAVQATYINHNNSPAGAPALKVRQDDSASPAPSAAPSSQNTVVTEPTTVESTPSAAETTTEAAPTTTAAPQTTPSPSEPAASTQPPVDTPVTSNPAVQSTTTTQAAATSQQETAPASSQEQQPETTPEPTTITSIVIIQSTAADGEIHSVTSAATIVSTPTLNAGDNEGGGGGMSTQTRNTVIGVVGGVGGAIVLGALAFVAWRIWGRKRKHEENDGLMDYHTAGTSAFNSEPKPDATSQSTAPSRSPFQTTLEDYHRPGQVNASSNF